MKDIELLKETILSNVRLGDVLKSKGIIHNSDHEEQFSCPFHGVDNKKSSRYYNDTDTAYCWVCKERWDLFSFISKQENVRFFQAVNIIVKKYNIDVSRVPDMTDGAVTRIKEKQRVNVNQRKILEEKLKHAIQAIRDEVSLEKYCKMAFAFSLLKYVTPDEKFEESSTKLRKAILKLIKPVGVLNG